MVHPNTGHWHMSKEVTMSTVVGLVTTMILGSIAYGKTQNKLDELQKDVTAASQTHVAKAEINQKFQSQEYKIEVIAEDVRELKTTLKENQKMMIELLQRVPKPN